MRLRRLAIVFSGLLLTSHIHGQTAPSFDVVSVKPSQPGAQRGPIGFGGERMTVNAWTLPELTLVSRDDQLGPKLRRSTYLCPDLWPVLSLRIIAPSPCPRSRPNVREGCNSRTAAGGELLFNVITDRYERRATVVTTNLAFAEWVTVFASDEKLTTALLDRLAHHATVITTKGKSYGMRQRRGQPEDA